MGEQRADEPPFPGGVGYGCVDEFWLRVVSRVIAEAEIFLKTGSHRVKNNTRRRP